MTAAFVLSINMFIAALFAVAFTVVASTNPTVRGARWLAAAYGIGVIDVALEFILPSLAQPTPVVVAIYVSYLAALTCGLIGVARHYGAALPRSATAIVWLAGLAFVPVMLGLPYGSALRTLLYQLPYAAMQVLMVAVVVRSGGKLALDRLLVVVGALAVLVYLAKPAIAWWIGTADHAQAYLASDYAAISQTMGSVVLIALALVLLLVIMRDTTMEMIARSETDPLSGALNRRGFETHGDRAVARARRTDRPLSLITLDLDRFKAINDSFGHAAGDRVIADLAGLLDDTVGSDDLVARLGGEEFAILLPGRTTAQAKALAERMRLAVARDLPVRLDNAPAVTASFGVAELQFGERLSDLCRRSDLALYEAKAAGRDTVCAAPRLRSVKPDAAAAEFAAPSDRLVQSFG